MTAPCACPICAATLVEITLSGDLTMRSCSRCERRWWQQGDDAAGLSDVLSVVAATAGKRVVTV